MLRIRCWNIRSLGVSSRLRDMLWTLVEKKIEVLASSDIIDVARSWCITNEGSMHSGLAVGPWTSNRRRGVLGGRVQQ